jgi:hypothetical protein
MNIVERHFNKEPVALSTNDAKRTLLSACDKDLPFSCGNRFKPW